MSKAEKRSSVAEATARKSENDLQGGVRQAELAQFGHLGGCGGMNDPEATKKDAHSGTSNDPNRIDSELNAMQALESQMKELNKLYDIATHVPQVKARVAADQAASELAQIANETTDPAKKEIAQELQKSVQEISDQLHKTESETIILYSQQKKISDTLNTLEQVQNGLPEGAKTILDGSKQFFQSAKDAIDAKLKELDPDHKFGDLLKE
jgi:hypothetical protein